MTEVRQLSWSTPEYLGIDWSPGPNDLATPHKELSREEFDRLMFHDTYSLCGINFNSVFVPEERDEKEKSLWKVNYYLHLSYTVAVTSLFVSSRQLEELKSKYPLGDWVKHDDAGTYVFFSRFWRIGCKHEKMIRTNPRMFQHIEKCPDCGYTREVWSD